MNTPEQIQNYRTAALQGCDATAQFNLGRAYLKGDGVPQSDTEAVTWYRKAAEQGHADSQYIMGLWSITARGLDQDDAAAVVWFRKAADQGNADAENYLGWCYGNGRGVEKDYAAAVTWYRKAADQGSAIAQYNLGWCYENGRGVTKDETQAVAWYRKAAAQGHENAKKNLARMEAAEPAVTPPPPPAKAAPQRKITVNQQVDRHIEHSQTLLSACTPTVYRFNAFRITGLLVDASTRDIKRRIDDLKHADEMGEAEDEHKHAFALDPTPTIEQIRIAAQSLQDPERRLIEEFFWFWPNQWGNGRTDPALLALANVDKDAAFKFWMTALSDGHNTAGVVAKHNLAVMYHLVALDSEHYALESELASDQHQTIAKYWRTCFKWWEELTEDETFWSLVTERIRMFNEPDRLKTGFARQMRVTLPEALDMINAVLAIEFAKRGKVPLVANQISYMKESHQGQDNVPKTLAIVIKPQQTQIVTAVEKAKSSADKHPTQGANSARELLQAVAHPVEIIQLILPAEGHERIDLCDSVADACLKCQIAYARETKDWGKSLEILDAAMKYAVSAETKARLAENRTIVANNLLFGKYRDPLVKKIEEIETKQSIAAKVQAVEDELLPQLKNLDRERFKGMSPEVYSECVDLVARYIRGLSVDTYNKNNDLAGSLRILDLAIAIACCKETCDLLKKDKDQLDTIRAESTKHDLHMQIRSDDIEITREFVRYNQQKLLVSQILGIKFGVFVQYTNGVESSCSYLIDIAGGQSESIHIECKRFFRSKEQAEHDFNSIVESIYHQVAPSLVKRLAESVVSGHPLEMGGARLTKEGVFVTKGSLWWKEEVPVPWSDVRFGTRQGHLHLSSSSTNVTASMALRDAWNAVFFKFIAEAVLELKSERGV